MFKALRSSWFDVKPWTSECVDYDSEALDQSRYQSHPRAQVAGLADSMHGESRLQMGGARPGSLSSQIE